MAPRIIVPFRRALATDSDNLRTDIYEFLTDIGVTLAWAAHAELVYMAFYELAVNALSHGRATGLALASREGVVTLHDDGKGFGLTELRAGGRGGNVALSLLENAAAGSLSVRYLRTRGHNEWSMVDELLTLGDNTPCGLVIAGQRVSTFGVSGRGAG